jgi:hypothetical protein
VLSRGEKFALQNDYVCGRRKRSRHWEMFRCVAFFAYSKGEGRKERKKEVEHLDVHPFIYNII